MNMNKIEDIKAEYERLIKEDNNLRIIQKWNPMIESEFNIEYVNYYSNMLSLIIEITFDLFSTEINKKIRADINKYISDGANFKIVSEHFNQITGKKVYLLVADDILFDDVCSLSPAPFFSDDHTYLESKFEEKIFSIIESYL